MSKKISDDDLKQESIDSSKTEQALKAGQLGAALKQSGGRVPENMNQLIDKMLESEFLEVAKEMKSGNLEDAALELNYMRIAHINSLTEYGLASTARAHMKDVIAEFSGSMSKRALWSKLLFAIHILLGKEDKKDSGGNILGR